MISTSDSSPRASASRVASASSATGASTTGSPPADRTCAAIRARVRLVDLARPQRLAGSAQLGSGREHRDLRPARADDGREPDRGERTHLRRPEQLARGADRLAAARIAAARANVRTGVHRVDPDDVALALGDLDRHDGVRTLRHHGAGRDDDRLARVLRASERRAGGRLAADREAAGRVRRAHGVAVHRRAGERRQVDHRARVLRQHAAGGGSDRDRFGGDRLHAREHLVERFIDSRQVVHADFTIIARMAGDLIAGRYRLHETLGRGPMSSVWLAEDEELGRRVAVKTLAPSADRSRFEREARAAAALSHPNICAVYDYGEADGKPFMVLEYLPNGSLEERLKAGPLADDETLRIATELAAGLAHAHARGLVHRDLKPANVLFDVEGRAKIADFGIARMADNLGLTEAGTVLGTASYISPEQAAGQPAGPASDVYSFGVILFRMLTGRLPFVSTNAMELVRMHRDDEPPAVADVRPDVPPRLESITTAALAKDPADRPADGAALLRELRGDPGDATIVAAPGAFPPPAETDATQVLRPAAAAGARRRLPVVPLVIALVVLLGGGVALALALSGGGGGDGASTQAPPPSLSLPSVPSATTQVTTTEATTAATSTEATTTAPTTTARTTTAPPPTTAPVTTLPVTTAPVTTLPVTTAPPTTTAPVTTAPTVTDTTPTTTAAAPLQGTTTTVAP